MSKTRRRLIVIPFVLLIAGGVCFWLFPRKITITINDEEIKVPKDTIIVRDTENGEDIYVDFLSMLHLQGIPVHSGDFGITALLRGSKVVRLNADKGIAVVNGDSWDLPEEGYLYENQKLYVSDKLYKELFDQAIVYILTKR